MGMTVEHWNVFDAHCVVGRHLKLYPGGLHTTEDLLTEMDHFGIAEALVVDSLSRENHPAQGNARVLEAIAGQPRLHPAWAALPHGPADEQPPAEEFLADMRRHKVGAVMLYPGQYRFHLADWCVDAFIEPLADAGVPVFVNYGVVDAGGGGMDATDWRDVVDFCRRWPAMPVIVGEPRFRQGNRMMRRALEACGNLRIELSGCWLHRSVESITEGWGAERLIFGSNWPAMSQAPTLTPLTTADISDDDKRRIAGDNLRQLIAWCEPEHPSYEPPKPADEYVAFARSGNRPAEMTFLDNHGHLGGRSRYYYLPNCDLDGIVADMNRLGVRKTCVFGFSGIASDERPGNDYVAQAVRRYPDRFVGFTMLNPHRGEAEMLAELQRGAAMGLRGIKLIPHYQGYPPEGPLIDVACKWAHERKQIILDHHWGSVEQVERLVSTYPYACFFTGHSTGDYADVMRKHPNLYVCSCPLHTPRACENMVQQIGADRLLFGSDLQDLPIAWGLGPILFARLPVESKRLILGGNLEKILQRYSLTP
jgi:predicted TIM-barrel fold metal-dependent hydrolase